jgi:hypothetical protein
VPTIQLSFAGLSSRRPGFDPRPLRVTFVVDEAALRHCFILSTICCSYQQNEVTVPSINRTLLEIRELRPEKSITYVVILSVTLIFSLLTCTDSSRNTRQTARKVKNLIMVFRCIVVWCGVCLNKRFLYSIEKLGFVIALYHG